MARPPSCKVVSSKPTATVFKPEGVTNPDFINLTVCEFEAVRLIDSEKKNQYAAAKLMNVSQPTFSRLLESGRTKLAKAIVQGKAIEIKGGKYRIEKI